MIAFDATVGAHSFYELSAAVAPHVGAVVRRFVSDGSGVRIIEKSTTSGLVETRVSRHVASRAM